MSIKFQKLLSLQSLDADGIFNGIVKASQDQATEIKMREGVAAREYDNYFEAIAESHSISVMDHEVDLFLAQIPQSGLIIDIGGCWGWHWRRLAEIRPDIGVLIVDFVRSNLPHARNVLGKLVGNQVALMHADATALPIVLDENFQGFDGVWTVQTFQHIPAYYKAASEAFRVLKRGGYSLTILSMCKRALKLSKVCLVVITLNQAGWTATFSWLAHPLSRSSRSRPYSALKFANAGRKSFLAQNCIFPFRGVREVGWAN